MKKRVAFTLIEALLVVSITLVLCVLLTAAIHKVRASAERTSCANHMKQIGLALISYQDTHRRLLVSGAGGR